MDELFNEINYRYHLENFYVWPIDKNNSERKKYLDKYSNSCLQKIIDDSRVFAFYVIDELRKSKDGLTYSVYMNVDLIDEREIDTNLHGGWSADILYNPLGFVGDFWISRYILNKFFNTSLDIGYNEIEYYDEVEEAGSIIANPYIYISMSKKQFEFYESLESDIIIKTKK